MMSLREIAILALIGLVGSAALTAICIAMAVEIARFLWVVRSGNGRRCERKAPAGRSDLRAQFDV